MSKIVPKCPKVFWGFLLERNFCPLFHGGSSLGNSSKNQKNSQFHNCTKSFPKVCKRVFNMFWGKFIENFFCPVFPGGSGFRKFPKKSKKFKIPKVPKIVSKSVHTCFEHALGRFFRLFLPSVRCRDFSFSGLKNVSSVLRHTTQQTFFFHLRHSQYTQSQFRFSGLKILSSDSRTWK